MIARSAGPHHDCSAFIQACALPGAVYMTKVAREDAKSHFAFQTQLEVLDFIAHGGLQEPVFDNSTPLSKGPAQDIGRLVDAYTFSYGKKTVYLAFYLNFKNIWIVKSFHPPRLGERGVALSHYPFASLKEHKK